jgi:tryptophan-rich sensory protein
MLRNMVSFLLFLAVCLAAGWFGSQFEPGDWYQSLSKPAWTPPDAVFGPVWTLLYVMMGIAAWLVWRNRSSSNVTAALGLFAVQLILNALWSYLFFGLQRPALAFFELMGLWLVIVATVLAFRRIRPLAAVFLLPYLAWVSFALLLNFRLWRLNL